MSRLTRLLLVVRTLGLRWLLFRFAYAAKKKLGWFQRKCPQTSWSQVAIETASKHKTLPELSEAVQNALRLKVDSFEQTPWFDDAKATIIAEAEQILGGSFPFYSCQRKQIGFPPPWHSNPLTGETVTADVHFSRLSDFAFGDIKHIWETARFGSAYWLGRAYRLTNNERYADGFWKLFEDWCDHNPPNTSVHWKCGQEAALRLIAIVFTVGLLEKSPATTDERYEQLLRFASVTAERIEQNLSYALSQENNHGISETAGLYLIGILFSDLKKAKHWERVGKENLQKQILKLIDEDGAFSQHSLNYQRLTLQVLSICLMYGERRDSPLSPGCRQRIVSCVTLLAQLCDPRTGHVPVLGPNDGALVVPLNVCDYRDFRPVIQASAKLLQLQTNFSEGPWNEDLYWLGISAQQDDSEEIQTIASEGLPTADGYSVLKSNNSRAFLRCPQQLKFRPHHSDQLHLDLWHDGVNITPDGGSFSYNGELMPYFRGAEAHNTVQFDDRDQMPVLGRFLYGHWLNANITKRSDNVLQAEYRDYRRAFHRRRIECDIDSVPDSWLIEDEISGFQRQAVLRWRLNPELQWTLDGAVCQSEKCRIEIEIKGAVETDVSLGTGWVSWCYSQKQALPVLEIRTTHSPAIIRSHIRFQ